MSELAERGAGGMDAGRRKALRFFSQHWLAWLNMLVGIWVSLPWLAPILMHVGATGSANLIYLFYSPQCHQLPHRSYFLFGTG